MKFGIIGGNGFLASVELLSKISKKLNDLGVYRNSDYPELILHQAVKAPSRSMYLEGTGESFLPHYILIAKDLKKIGCDTLLIPCNTAHFFINELENEVGPVFINLLEEVSIELHMNYPEIKKVGILCSDGLYKNKFYDSYLKKQNPSLEIFYPEENYQKLVTKCIINIQKGYHLHSPVEGEDPYFLFQQIS